MANAGKILSKMRNNPRDWRIEDLKVLADHFGIAYRQHGTSHVTFWHSSAGLLPVPAARAIKVAYIRRFLALIDALEDTK
jgi:hypothetical protein